MIVLTKIINFNKLGFYVALTLFWSLFLHHFKKDTHHYYKMYDVNKFFKLLHSHDREEKQQELNLSSTYQLLLLIFIYQNYVLLSKESACSHQVFQDVFKVSPHDCEKLRAYLLKMKALVELRFPVDSMQDGDALMVSTFKHLKYHQQIGLNERK